MTTIGVSGWMFLLVLAHHGWSRKMVLCVCVSLAVCCIVRFVQLSCCWTYWKFLLSACCVDCR